MKVMGKYMCYWVYEVYVNIKYLSICIWDVFKGRYNLISCEYGKEWVGI